jgi:hypothetical protein
VRDNDSSMADQLFLCYWLRGYTAVNMLRHFERMLRRFPFLPQNPSNIILRVHAISYQEPILLERPFNDPMDLAEIISAAGEFRAPDIACQVDAWWGLWQLGREWGLKPARISLSCFGPEFEAPEGEHLRIDFGLDSQFLPPSEAAGASRFIGSNIRSLLHLVRSLDEALSPQKRLLMTESGDNFAGRLKDLSMEL